MEDDRPVRTGIDELLRRWRHAGADLHRAKLVGDVVDPDAGILVSREDQRLALKALRPVLVDIVRGSRC
jgi:hypothetical protein